MKFSVLKLISKVDNCKHTKTEHQNQLEPAHHYVIK